MDQVWIKFTWRRRSSRRLEFRVCELRSRVQNILVLIAQVYTHTQKFDVSFQEQEF